MDPVRAVARSCFLPAMLALAVVGCAIAAGDAPEPAAAVAVVAAIALSFAAERLLPYEPDWNRDRGDRRRDVAHAVVNEGSVLVTLAVLPRISGDLVAVDLWPTALPFAAQVVVAVLVADLGITVVHRLSHAVGWLWRLHAVHHSVTRFYGFNGLMKHPVHQLVELLAGTTPLVLVGMPPSVAGALAVCVAVQLLLQHSNADYATGGVERWLAVNRPHRFHHLAAPGDGDVNFGLFTTIWDRWLLGTYHADPTRGFVSADLGVGGRPDYPTRYRAQLVEPFRRRGLVT